MRQRYELVRTLLPPCKVERLLEIGYGSGIFLPELSKYANELFGADVHPHPRDVAVALDACGVTAKLTSADASALPYSDQQFDIVVSVSSLEFITDLRAACGEIARVLKPSGSLIVVTPASSPLLDFGLWLLTRQSAKRDFNGRRESVIPTLQQHFEIEQAIHYPKGVGALMPLYRALRLRPHLPPEH
ncbi:MAG: class I SAM-dependent methyltransferase [Candidatus Eremiobacteraeota bacterium]|nr:class I SAM-dependent methyltransferase [Candidatus Eremiobacteraeota bacterium]